MIINKKELKGKANAKNRLYTGNENNRISCKELEDLARRAGNLIKVINSPSFTLVLRLLKKNLLTVSQRIKEGAL